MLRHFSVLLSRLCVPVSFAMCFRLCCVRPWFPFHVLVYLAALGSTIITRFLATMAASDSRSPFLKPYISLLALPILFWRGLRVSHVLASFSTASPALNPRWDRQFGFAGCPSLSISPAPLLIGSALHNIFILTGLYRVHLSIPARLFRCLRFIPFVTYKDARLATGWAGFPSPVGLSPIRKT